MKHTFLLFLFVTISSILFSQDNRYAKYGYEPKIATMTNGKFIEIHDRDTIVQIGRVVYNTMSKEIIGFVAYDTMYSEATLAPDVVSRWLSPDPLQHMRLWLSPYNFVQNNPIMRIDPDGRLDGWVEGPEGNVSWDENTNSQADFDKNYAGKDGFKYVSDPNNANDYHLPSGEGTLRMNDWSTYPGDHKMDVKGIQLDMQFIASNSQNSSGWMQTVNSNGGMEINGSNFGRESSYLQSPKPFVDSKFTRDPTQSDFFSRTGRFSDILGRIPLQTRGIDMLWKAETSFVNNNSPVISVTWGMNIAPNGGFTPITPTIVNGTSDYHNTAIKHLPE